ncbi:MAG TPA: hypothetical protein VNA15_02695 [Candidatus Angelobacter sp.]|nr:hypothetical protein [Candidatus Angelobacter sp.]
MVCSICGQATEEARLDLCATHTRALHRLEQAYDVWVNAFGGIAPADFLKRLARLRETGKNAKEIVDFLQQHPEKWK